MKSRSSGVLLHITSLPSPHGVGDMGPEAYRFVDFLSGAAQRFWQILPLNPTGTYLGNAPYTSYSAFAGNPLLISLEMLQSDGLLESSDLEISPPFSADHCDYSGSIDYKGRLLRKAFENFKNASHLREAFEHFCAENGDWLEDYASFVALKDRFEESAWYDWPKEYRDRDQTAMHLVKTELADRIVMAKFFQYLFFKQWFSLKEHCRNKNIKIIGDIPIYTSIDSSDVWSAPQMYKLNEEKQPLFVAGAPPDYFSETGQRWGNPVYRWDYFRETGYEWWIKRIGHNLKLYDFMRLDHFRGFVAYWEIPAEDDTAVNGKWVQAPAMEFFETLMKRFPGLPLIAEDLGLITADVKNVMEHFRFPGMKVLLFAFGPDLPTNPYAPHNYARNCVVYTGTHDNNTVRGWFQHEASAEDKQRFFDYTGREMPEDEIHWEWIRMAMASVANVAIIPMQDLLGAGQEARMNHPSRSEGNWTWRVRADQITDDLRDRLRHLTWLYNRENKTD